MKYAVVLLVVVVVSAASWKGFGAAEYHFRRLRPVVVGAPFVVAVTDVAGTRASLDWRDCTPVFVVDAFCAGCRTAAHEWREGPGKPGVWLMVNSREEAAQFAEMFMEKPARYFVANRPQRLAGAQVLERLRLSASPMTAMVDSAGIVRNVLMGVVGQPQCSASP